MSHDECQDCGDAIFEGTICITCAKLREERSAEVRERYGDRAQVVPQYKPNRKQKRIQAHMKRKKK